jgi:hypothetical protein
MIPTFDQDGAPTIVVFADNRTRAVLQLLRPGFRHCFAALQIGDGWVACDPLKDRIQLALVPRPGDFDLAAFYASQGHRVLVGRTVGERPRAPGLPTLLTCVAIVKRLLGIRAPTVVTPWQLYRHLRHCEGPGAWRPFAPADRSSADSGLDIHVE